MVIIKLYALQDNPNVINKQLSGEILTQGWLTNNTDLDKPIITINYKEIGVNIWGVNYCDLTSVFKRYYFVERIEIVDNSRARLYLKCDVLKSFSSWLEDKYIEVTESQEKGIKNKFLSNRNSIFDVRPKKKKLEFSEPNKLNKEGSIIMITLKGT